MSMETMYPVMETFLTIQGEGYYQGHSAYFVRLAGCDVGCTWCDVKESWNKENYPTFSAADIAGKVESSGAKLCVITGGEPLMYNLTALTSAIRGKGIKTHLETSGAWPLSGTWDWICISPKRFKLPQTEVLQAADEYKVVIHHPNDIRFAERYIQHIRQDCKLYLQPEWERRGEMMPAILDYLHRNPEWVLGIQAHKYVEVP